MKQQLIFNYESVDDLNIDVDVEYNPPIPQDNKKFLAQEPMRQRLQMTANQMAKEFMTSATGTHINRTVANDLPTDNEWYTYTCHVRKIADSLAVVGESLNITTPEIKEYIERVAQHIGVSS